MKEKEATRINKYLSEIGYCSRRAADKLIEEKIKRTRIPYTFSDYKLGAAGYSMRGGKNTKKRRNRRKNASN